jgi:hypothetical protein
MHMSPIRARLASQHGADHSKSQRQQPALVNELGRSRRQVLDLRPRPARKDLPRLLRRQQIGAMLLRAHLGGNGRIPSREKKPRPQGFGPEWLDIAGAPHVIDNHQRSFVPHHRPVPVDALQFGFLVSRFVSEPSPHLLHARDQIVDGLLARGGPDDAVGERQLSRHVVREGLGQNSLADAAHSSKCREGNARSAAVGDQKVAETGQFVGTLHEVRRQRRRRDVVIRLKCYALARANVSQQSFEAGRVGFAGEVEVIRGPEMPRNLAAAVSENWDDTPVPAQGSELFGAADLGHVRARCQQRQEELGFVDTVPDLRWPSVAAADLARIHPHVEPALRQVPPQTSGQFRAILPRVRDEYAGALSASHSQASI